MLVVGQGPDGTESGGCCLLAATDRVIIVLVPFTGIQKHLACDPGAPGVVNIARHIHLRYATMPGGLASSWRQAHIVRRNSPLVPRPWLVAPGYVLHHVSHFSPLHLSVDTATSHVHSIRRQIQIDRSVATACWRN